MPKAQKERVAKTTDNLGPSCFVEGTLVSTKNGLRPIETLKAKDLVWSRDESSGETQLKPIAQTFERYSATLSLTFDNGETIETTSEHPFYVVGRGFVKAGELGIGTSIVTRAGPPVQFVSAKPGKAQTVYNFEVKDFHSYFVSESALWVHNARYQSKSGRDAFSETQIKGADGKVLTDFDHIVPNGNGKFDLCEKKSWQPGTKHSNPNADVGKALAQIEEKYIKALQEGVNLPDYLSFSKVQSGDIRFGIMLEIPEDLYRKLGREKFQQEIIKLCAATEKRIADNYGVITKIGHRLDIIPNP